jgi:glucokinase
MYLAGDIGGTNTRLGRAILDAGVVEISEVEVYDSAASPGLEPILERYLDEHPGPLHGAAFGVPGPVTGRQFRTTNIPWVVDQDELERLLGVRVSLGNDLEVAAHGTLVMPAGSSVVLNAGQPHAGNRAILAAGTGLGEGVLFARDGTYFPSASEGGHASFAPCDDEEVELWRFARSRFGHVSFERILSGRGIVLLYEFYRARLGAQGRPLGALPWTDGGDEAAAVARAAADGKDEAALAALRRFASIYGGEAANLALKVLALGGVHVAGGIAPKILPFLTRGEFLDAFLDKGRYRELLSRVRVDIVTDGLLGMRGAARVAHLAALG